VGLPKSKEAQPFYRCALQRLEDAYILRRGDRTTGAVYLAGYGIECILKALILENLSAKRRKEMLEGFRGQRAHSFDWLRDQYRQSKAPGFPQEVNKSFLLVQEWSTELRYIAGVRRPGDADAFLRAAQAIVDWADGRL
jgi:HEPN domain